MKRFAPVLVLLVIALAPAAAHACPVCFQAKNDASRLAFLVTTLFMTVLPLGLFGGLAYWVKRRSDALDGEGPSTRATDAADESQSPTGERIAPPAGRPTPAR